MWQRNSVPDELIALTFQVDNAMNLAVVGAEAVEQRNEPWVRHLFIKLEP